MKKIQEAAPLQNLYTTIKHRKKSEKLQRDSVCITQRERERERETDRQTDPSTETEIEVSILRREDKIVFLALENS